MRVDLEYLSRIMDIFLEADTAHVNLEDIASSGIDIGENSVFNERFIFHMQIAIDNQLIGLRDSPAYSLRDIGLTENIDGIGNIHVLPIRLTQNGHDFACSLNNKEVLDRLKTEFKDAPFKVVFEGGQKLLQHFAKKKLNELV